MFHARLRIWCTSCLSLLPVTLQLPATTETCTPGGLSVYYETTYYIVENEGLKWGWDSSDPRYRFPTNNTFDGIHGGNATIIYEHEETGAMLYLGSKHTALWDTIYMGPDCLNINAVINFDVALPQQPCATQAPYWAGGWYPDYTPKPARDNPRGYMPVMSQISLPGDGWFHYWTEVEAFIDEQLAAGNNTFMYDMIYGCGPGEREDEWCSFLRGPNNEPIWGETPSCGPDCTGCGAAATAAVAYMITRSNMTRDDAYQALYNVRPCVEALTLMQEEEIMALTTKTYWDELKKLELGIEHNDIDHHG